LCICIVTILLLFVVNKAYHYAVFAQGRSWCASTRMTPTRVQVVTWRMPSLTTSSAPTATCSKWTPTPAPSTWELRSTMRRPPPIISRSPLRISALHPLYPSRPRYWVRYLLSQAAL